MPGFDRTGPDGVGPMTGGMRGYCAGNAPSRRFGRGRRMGGFGRGRGLGFGPGAPWRGWDPQPVDAASELDFLRQQAADIASELSRINQRIDQLGGAQTEE
ncbi:MAG: DUF5320 domain-containing protein [Desulfatibacillaceae bacterium]